MPEFLETILGVFALSATVWLGLGFWLSHTLKQTPAKAHGILVASLIGTLVTPLFFWLVSQANWGMLPARVEQAGSTSVNPEAVEQGISITGPVMTSNQDQGMSLGNRPEPFYPPEAFGGVDSGSTNTFPPVSTAPLSWKHWVLVVWLGLTGILFLRLMLDFVLGYRLFRSSRLIQSQKVNQELETQSRKMGNRVIPKLATSKEVPSPVLWAWSRPARILIPQGIDGNKIPAGVYLHELAHLARKDHVWAFLGELVLCLLPWHPLSWIIRRQLSDRAEEACDDWVIACGCQPLDYADELVKLAPSMVGILTMAAVSKRSRLKERVSRLVAGVFSSPKLGRRWIVGALVSGVLLAFCMASIQPQSLKAEILSPTVQEEEPNEGGPSKNHLAQDKPEPANRPDQKKQILTSINKIFAQTAPKTGDSLNPPAPSPIKNLARKWQLTAWDDLNGIRLAVFTLAVEGDKLVLVRPKGRTQEWGYPIGDVEWSDGRVRFKLDYEEKTPRVDWFEGRIDPKNPDRVCGVFGPKDASADENGHLRRAELEVITGEGPANNFAAMPSLITSGLAVLNSRLLEAKTLPLTTGKKLNDEQRQRAADDFVILTELAAGRKSDRKGFLYARLLVRYAHFGYAKAEQVEAWLAEILEFAAPYGPRYGEHLRRSLANDLASGGDDYKPLVKRLRAGEVMKPAKAADKD